MLVEADIKPNQPYKLTIADFELLAEAGAFRDNKRVELIDGRIIVMSPVYRRHYRAHSQMFARLLAAIERSDEELELNIGPSVAIPPYSEPLPDIVVSVRPMSEKGIEVEAVRLIVEVSDSTARYDLRAKAELYAAAGIPEYWVVDMQQDQINQFWAPADEKYQSHRTVALGGSILAETVLGLTVDTSNLI